MAGNQATRRFALECGGEVKRTSVYGQLDKVLRLFGFSCKLLTDEPPTRLYEHDNTTARFMLPAFPKSERVLDYHLLGVRTSLDLYGIADPDEFAAKLKKAS